MLLDVASVVVQRNFVLLLEFENGERRRFDMAPYMDRKPWRRLKEANTFNGAFIECGTVSWPGHIDIDPETLYERSEPLTDQEQVGAGPDRSPS